MIAHMTAKDLTTMARIFDDLWNHKVTSENFFEWRKNYGADILDGFITTKVMVDALETVEVHIA
jgi:hypothetical protein